MKIATNFFRKKNEKNNLKEISKWAGFLTSQFDRVALDTLRAHGEDLSAEDDAYIVPAVWGVTASGELTPIQRDIYARVAPAIDEAFEMLRLKHISPVQEFMVYSLIRNLFIAKMLYLVEGYRRRVCCGNDKIKVPQTFYDIAPGTRMN